MSTELIDGQLTYVQGLGPFFIKADVTIDNQIVLKNQVMNVDVGTDNIEAYVLPFFPCFYCTGEAVSTTFIS